MQHRATKARTRFPAYLLLLVLGLAILGVATFPGSQSEPTLPHLLIQNLSSVRPAKARLFNSPASPPSNDDFYTARAEAQVAILSIHDSRQLQALLDIRTGDLPAAAELLNDLNRTRPNNAEVLNDLGVVYLALGESNPVEYFKALQFFEQARQLNPMALAPQFNLVLAYRKAGLDDLAGSALATYARRERNLFWVRELEVAVPPSDSKLATELTRDIDARDYSKADALFRAHANTYRRLATEEALNPQATGTPSALLRFVAGKFLQDYQDASLSEMVKPLEGPFRDQVIRARGLVKAGIAYYITEKSKESLLAFEQAEDEIAGYPKVFDANWIELNIANTEIRQRCFGCAASAGRRLEKVIAESKRMKLLWIVGQALTSVGSNSTSSGNFEEVTDPLNEAVHELRSIGAEDDSVRALNYLAFAYTTPGDFESSFRYAHQAMKLTQKNDHVRLLQYFFLAGVAANRFGCIPCTIAFQKQEILEARSLHNLQMEISALSYLASTYEATGETGLATSYLKELRSIMSKVSPTSTGDLVELPVNLLCSRIEISGNKLKSAQECITRNLAILRAQPVVLPVYYSPTLLQQARIFILSGRIDKARETFHQATEVIEANDAYFATPGARTSFENERRNLYDDAIAFEADHGGMDAAWTYVQHYRSKLFLEFLGEMNPKVNQIHSEAAQRNQIQKHIPKDVQVLEYLMLPDRLLIWFVSENKFISKSIVVSRADLQKRVNDFIDATRNQRDVTAQSDKLYRLLIAPIENELDSHRALAIIPDQDLHRLPFPALWNASTHRYLIEDFALLESPNLTQLLANLDAPLRTSVVAFGAIEPDASASSDFSAIKTLYPGNKTFTGNAVNKREFLKAMTDATIFQYSGHSVDASDPLRSSLLLDGDREGPNSITAVDISQQRMRTNSLVVLASCDSSVGNSRDGIGMRGLTSAFLISGTGSVVGSLWLVETVSTSHLISDFHQRFASGMSAAESLRRSQIAFIRSGTRTSHPNFWSGFVVTGSISALR